MTKDKAHSPLTSELAERVAGLNDKIEDLIRVLADEREARTFVEVNEIRTRRVVVIDDEGRERIVLAAAGNAAASIEVFHPHDDDVSIALVAGGDVELESRARAECVVSDGKPRISIEARERGGQVAVVGYDEHEKAVITARVAAGEEASQPTAGFHLISDGTSLIAAVAKARTSTSGAGQCFFLEPVEVCEELARMKAALADVLGAALVSDVEVNAVESSKEVNPLRPLLRFACGVVRAAVDRTTAAFTDRD